MEYAVNILRLMSLMAWKASATYSHLPSPGAIVRNRHWGARPLVSPSWYCAAIQGMFYVLCVVQILMLTFIYNYMALNNLKSIFNT